MDIAEVMFPGGSPHLVEPIYKNPKLSAPFNEQLAAAVVARVRHLLPALNPGQKVRIVEIGSGSGGTSAPVMEALTAADGGNLQQHVEFLYTDISAQLVGYGRRTYGPAHPFARFKVTTVMDLCSRLRHASCAKGKKKASCIRHFRKLSVLLVVTLMRTIPLCETSFDSFRIVLTVIAAAGCGEGGGGGRRGRRHLRHHLCNQRAARHPQHVQHPAQLQGGPSSSAHEVQVAVRLLSLQACSLCNFLW